ncbi:hypothetical protein IFM89_037717 [Coptis chinensis]|uniref:Uncharacterized protein n=1 Tax=Coptis chinensis TaxID=261450 RepID=A0A835II74_9MAGN|nr:hypothetical protein IFM89_037717 [Coptis chinensis]
MQFGILIPLLSTFAALYTLSMGLDTESDFDKYCKVVRNPTIGHISRRHSSKAELRVENGKPSTRNYHLRNLGDDFTEISFGRSRSSSCKSMAHMSSAVASNEALRRDLVYQDSEEVRKMKKMGSLEERRKIELSPSNGTSLSFRIFNTSLLDKTCPLVDKRRSTLLSLNEDSPSSDVSKCRHPTDCNDLSFRFPSTQPSSMARSMSSDGSFNVSKDLKDRKDCTSGKFTCNQTISPLDDGNGLLESDTFYSLHKSLSEKVGMQYSPRCAESDNSKDSSRVRFSPFRKMWDPIMKSKSLRSLPVSRAELGKSTTVGSENVKQSRTLRKSLLNDFSNTAHKMESDTEFVKKDHHSKVVTSSPAHLHGLLKLELKHGVPYFEFTFKDPEDVLSAKTWRANNAFNWVYTFHSMKSRRTSNSSGWGTRERHKESSMIGQMQVSCFLLSEIKHSGAFDNSMVTEFVLYDIMHARRTLGAQNSSDSSTKSVEAIKGATGENLVVEGIPCEQNDSYDAVNDQHQTGHASATDNFDVSPHYPWAPADLHPNLEIAAIVIQVPFEKRESLKDKQVDKLGAKEQKNLFDFSAFDHRNNDNPSGVSRANVKVVTPTRAHGLPSKKSGGIPSPILERWRSGGCCDCGGWDMACPLHVFDNCEEKMKDRYMGNQQPIELFFQGAKDKLAAVTIKSTGEGQYSVDFHARLSKLQAFSICVAILHGCEASTAIEQEKNPQTFHCNSLKVLFDEEVKFLIGAAADKDKRSPIARA